MPAITAPASITVDGTEYPITGFSEQLQRLVEIHTTWRNDLQAQRVDVAKTEAALRNLEQEMSQAIQTELKAKADAAAAAAAANDPAPAPTVAATVVPATPAA